LQKYQIDPESSLLRLLYAEIQTSCHTVTSMLRVNGHHPTVSWVKHMAL
jgi:hypothetical protein